MMLSQAVTDFIEWGRVSYAHRTILTYEKHLRGFVSWVGDKELADLDPLEISRYAESLRRRGLAESSMAYVLIAIRQMFKFLFFRRAIDWDYRLIRVPRYTQNSYPPISIDQARQMIDNVKLDGSFMRLRDKTILSVLWDTGVRVSELCDLKVGELQVKDRSAKIITKKNKKPRLLFWSPTTAALLAEYLPRRHALARTPNVFISLDRAGNMGGRLTTRSVERFVVRYRLDVPATPHWYRHGLGHDLMEVRAHPRPSQLLLGHKHISSGEIYWDMDATSLRKVFRRVQTIRRVGDNRAVDRPPRGV